MKDDFNSGFEIFICQKDELFYFPSGKFNLVTEFQTYHNLEERSQNQLCKNFFV